MQWFCKEELEDYLDTFSPRREAREQSTTLPSTHLPFLRILLPVTLNPFRRQGAKLEFTERRWLWLRRELTHFDEQLAQIFPMSWRIDELLWYTSPPLSCVV